MNRTYKSQESPETHEIHKTFSKGYLDNSNYWIQIKFHLADLPETCSDSSINAAFVSKCKYSLGNESFGDEVDFGSSIFLEISQKSQW